MNPYVTCTVCGLKLDTTNIQKKFCDDCRKIRDRESRRRSNQRRRDEGYKMPPKADRIYASDCDTCKLEIGCRAQLKMNLDPLCWNGPDTTNEYYHLYEKAKVETGISSR